MRTNERGKRTAVGPSPTNGGSEVLAAAQPYVVDLSIRGVADMLLHRYNNEAVAEKGAAAKGSRSKRTDDLESYVYRDADRNICIPGEYVRQAIIHAAKFRQDPRSPRKSAVDLFKAGLVCLTDLAPIGPKPGPDWHYEDRRRVLVQRSAVTRVRPAIRAGWELDVRLAVLLPEYITPELLAAVIQDAGRLVGIADFRPTYGRFVVSRFSVAQGD